MEDFLEKSPGDKQVAMFSMLKQMDRTTSQLTTQINDKGLRHKCDTTFTDLYGVHDDEEDMGLAGKVSDWGTSTQYQKTRLQSAEETTKKLQVTIRSGTTERHEKIMKVQ